MRNCGFALKPLAAVVAAASIHATAGWCAPIGAFTGHADVGAPAHAGDATFDRTTGTYRVTAGGANVFGAKYEFHFVWVKVKGDFAISSDIAFTGPGKEPHRKAGLMVRQSLDAGSAYVDAAIHGQGPKTLQDRKENGGQTEMLMTQATPEAPSPVPADARADRVRLERSGEHYRVTITEPGKPSTVRDLDGAELGETVYVGLFLCAHDADAVEHAEFANVDLTKPASHH